MNGLSILQANRRFSILNEAKSLISHLLSVFGMGSVIQFVSYVLIVCEKRLAMDQLRKFSFSFGRYTNPS
jgi:hypothetical protein